MCAIEQSVSPKYLLYIIIIAHTLPLYTLQEQTELAESRQNIFANTQSHFAAKGKYNNYYIVITIYKSNINFIHNYYYFLCNCSVNAGQ